MKLSDYVADYIANLGTKKVFLVTGGACVHLVNSISKHEKLGYVCMQHEQSAAMAAEAYSRVGPGIGVAVATSGPGATNFITGICGAWFDSIPTLFITGNVNMHEMKGMTKLRQVGFQETDIVNIVSSVTKFSHTVTDPEKIKYYLDKAIFMANSGRPGPVLLDLPMNIQHAEIDPEKLIGFVPDKNTGDEKIGDGKMIKKALQLIKSAKRPVILAGGGIRISEAAEEFREFVKYLGFPVVCSWSGIDVLGYDNPLFIGQIGVYGNRGANFLIQNADLVISIGSRLDTRQVSGNAKSFARAAKKIIVDIDAQQLKDGRVRPDIAIHSDVKQFLLTTMPHLKNLKKEDIAPWLTKALEWKRKYPTCLPEYRKEKKFVNPYVFFKTLSEELRPDDIIISDIGGVLVWVMQSLEIKEGQRLFSSMGHAAMGYGLPAGIGAALATKKSRIICIVGDGGMQMNIQELQTIFHHKLPLKIFIVNNNCYGIVRQYEDSYFNGEHEGTVQDSGYTAPDFVMVGKSYKIPSSRILNHSNMRSEIRRALGTKGAEIIDVIVREDQKLIPKLEAKRMKNGRYISKPIEDQWPYLSRKEFTANMIIPPTDEIDDE